MAGKRGEGMIWGTCSLGGTIFAELGAICDDLVVEWRLLALGTQDARQGGEGWRNTKHAESLHSCCFSLMAEIKAMGIIVVSFVLKKIFYTN